VSESAVGCREVRRLGPAATAARTVRRPGVVGRSTGASAGGGEFLGQPGDLGGKLFGTSVHSGGPGLLRDSVQDGCHLGVDTVGTGVHFGYNIAHVQAFVAGFGDAVFESAGAVGWKEIG
jgi:hypothetical protein